MKLRAAGSMPAACRRCHEAPGPTSSDLDGLHRSLVMAGLAGGAATSRRHGGIRNLVCRRVKPEKPLRPSSLSRPVDTAHLAGLREGAAALLSNDRSQRLGDPWTSANP